MINFNKIFSTKKPVIGMIHLDALPGTPKHKGNVQDIFLKAMRESETYIEAGIDSIVIENMHDVPYLKRDIGHEISTVMSIIGYEIKKRTEIPVGIQILAGANKAAMAVAKSAGLDFIRAEGYVYGHLADEGLMESDAGELMRYRKAINAEDILILSDIKKKHSSHAITQDISIEKTAQSAEFFLSDGIIMTGGLTGDPVNIDELKSVKVISSLPIIIGSGISLDNVNDYFQICDGFIVGSYFKEKGNWQNSVDKKRVTKFIQKIETLRKNN
jgi:membrane complex biogenesis BtpA family protein